jgi:similar to stage IV sporulation protein
MRGIKRRLTSARLAKCYCAAPHRVIGKLTGAGVRVSRVNVSADGYFTFYCRERDKKKISELSRGGEFSAEFEGGGVRQGPARFILRRKYLILGLIAAFLLLRLTGLHVRRIEVYGNETVPRARIMYELEKLGFGYGTLAATVHSEQFKNGILAAIPELSYFAVNTRGSRAEVIVREREPVPEIFDREKRVDLVASRDGVVISVTATEGIAVVSVGTTVKKGSVLVASSPELAEYGMSGAHAAGEVVARTEITLEAVLPLGIVTKNDTGQTKHRYVFSLFGRTLTLGDAAQENAGSARKEYTPRLFGSYLPFELEVTRSEGFDAEKSELPEAVAERILRKRLSERLAQELAKASELGETKAYVHAFKFRKEVSGGVMRLTLYAEVIENIAVEKPIN